MTGKLPLLKSEMRIATMLALAASISLVTQTASA